MQGAWQTHERYLDALRALLCRSESPFTPFCGPHAVPACLSVTIFPFAVCGCSSGLFIVQQRALARPNRRFRLCFAHVYATAASRVSRRVTVWCRADSKVWDVTTQQCSATLTHHGDKVQGVAWHPVEATVMATVG